jgi:hypothetical protein
MLMQSRHPNSKLPWSWEDFYFAVIVLEREQEIPALSLMNYEKSSKNVRYHVNKREF